MRGAPEGAPRAVSWSRVSDGPIFGHFGTRGASARGWRLRPPPDTP